MQNFEHVWIATRFVKFIAERLILDLEPTGKFDAVTVPVDDSYASLRKKSTWRRSSSASRWRCFRRWFLVWFRTGTRTARLLSQQYNRKTRPVMLVFSITTASSFSFLSPSIVGALSESDEMNFIPSMCLGVDAETGTAFPGNGDCTSACSSTCYAGLSLSVLSLEYFDGAMDGIAVQIMDSTVVSSRSSSGHKTNSDVFKWSCQSFRTIDDFLGVWRHLEARPCNLDGSLQAAVAGAEPLTGTPNLVWSLAACLGRQSSP